MTAALTALEVQLSRSVESIIRTKADELLADPELLAKAIGLPLECMRSTRLDAIRAWARDIASVAPTNAQWQAAAMAVNSREFEIIHARGVPL